MIPQLTVRLTDSRLQNLRRRYRTSSTKSRNCSSTGSSRSSHPVVSSLCPIHFNRTSQTFRSVRICFKSVADGCCVTISLDNYRCDNLGQTSPPSNGREKAKIKGSATPGYCLFPHHYPIFSSRGSLCKIDLHITPVGLTSRAFIDNVTTSFPTTSKTICVA